ncbi:hypothetical protein PF010_g14100 [Phytophthora fragariae]|uniref:Uncharacterized protein n=1 Tax=Phytophthora fragariae TaxID=53985 RepID=A0A6G0KYR7_9STRA|nr:hypothetical protein PF010_g14100 [Phytophthora fragariae]
MLKYQDGTTLEQNKVAPSSDSLQMLDHRVDAADRRFGATEDRRHVSAVGHNLVATTYRHSLSESDVFRRLEGYLVTSNADGIRRLEDRHVFAGASGTRHLEGRQRTSMDPHHSNGVRCHQVTTDLHRISSSGVTNHNMAGARSHAVGNGTKDDSVATMTLVDHATGLVDADTRLVGKATKPGK